MAECAWFITMKFHLPLLLLLSLIALASCGRDNIIAKHRYDLSDSIPGPVMDILSNCAGGTLTGPMAAANVLAPECAVLAKGLNMGIHAIKFTSLELCSEGSACFKGTMNLADAFPGTTDSIWTWMLSFDQGSKRGVMTASSDMGATATLVEVLGLNGKKGDFSNVVNGMIGAAGLNDASFTLKNIGVVLDKQSAFVVEGSVNIASQSTSVGIYLSGGSNVAFNAGVSVDIAPATLNSLQNAILGPAAPYLTLFTFSQCAFTVANTNILFAYPLTLQNGASAFKEGFAISAAATWAAGSKNPIVQFLNTINPGGLSVNLAVTKTNLELAIYLPQLKISSQFTMVDINFHLIGDYAAVPANVVAGISSTLLYIPSNPNQNPLRFTGAIDVVLGDFATLAVTLTMQGTWNNAFGIQSLFISNVYAKLGMTPQPPFVSIFSFAGDAQIASVKGKIAFSMDLTDATNDYFFMEVEKFTVSNVVNGIFGLNWDIPAPLAETGFNTLKFTFANKATKTIPEGVDIPAGFFANADANFFGFQSQLRLSVTPERFDFMAQTQPFKIFQATFSKSKTELDKGPVIDIEVGTGSSIEWNSAAYLSCSYFTADVHLKMTTSSFLVEASADFFGYHADIYATFVRDPFSLSFNAKFNDPKVSSSALDFFNGFAKSFHIPDIAMGPIQNFLKDAANGVAIEFKGDLSGTTTTFAVAATCLGKTYTLNADLSRLDNIFKNLTNDLGGRINDLISKALSQVQDPFKKIADPFKKIADPFKKIRNPFGRYYYANVDNLTQEEKLDMITNSEASKQIA